MKQENIERVNHVSYCFNLLFFRDVEFLKGKLKVGEKYITKRICVDIFSMFYFSL